MAFPVSSQVVSAATVLALVANINSVMDSGESYKKVFGSGWGESQISALEDALVKDGWQPQPKANKIFRVKGSEIYYVKGKAIVYAATSDFIDSFVSVEVAA